VERIRQADAAAGGELQLVIDFNVLRNDRLGELIAIL
jgi:hypothetical protein